MLQSYGQKNGFSFLPVHRADQKQPAPALNLPHTVPVVPADPVLIFLPEVPVKPP